MLLRMKIVTSLFLLLLTTPLCASLVERFETSLLGGDIFWSWVMAAAAGFLTALSPCVYPLIPVALAIMGTRRDENHVHGFFVALSYVGGMCLVYAALGALFASIGMMLGGIMQSPWVLMVIGSFFVLMALSLFGVFDVVIPQQLLTKLSHVGGKGKRGAFLMGMVAGVLAAPCTGPVLGFILTLIASDHDIVQGVCLMVAFSVGMGMPFLVLGTFFSMLSRIPKSGPWMDCIKNFFGAIILGTALYYFSLALPSIFDFLHIMRRAGAVGIVAIFMVALCLLAYSSKKSRARYLMMHALGAILAGVSVASLLTFDDARIVVKSATDEQLTWHVIDDQIPDVHAFERLLDDARQQNRAVLIDFYADWCVACKQLDAMTFKNDSVKNALARFMLIRIDATKSTATINDLENRFRVVGLPTVVMIERDGKLSSTKIQGFVEPEQFLSLIENL
jgi:thiol:disulfide interchange protein DsbD